MVLRPDGKKDLGLDYYYLGHRGPPPVFMHERLYKSITEDIDKGNLSVNDMDDVKEQIRGKPAKTCLGV